MYYGLLLGRDNGDGLVRGHAFDAIVHHRNELFRCPSAQVLVLPDDDLIKHHGRHPPNFIIVLHPPVANAGHNAHLGFSFHLLHQFLQGPEPGSVVGIIQHDLKILEGKQVQPAWRL